MKNEKLVIFDPDPFSAVSLEKILEKKGLGSVCRVVSQAEDSGFFDDARIILLSDQKNAPSGGRNVREGDIFQKPVRLGSLLDHIGRIVLYRQAREENEICRIGPYSLYPDESILKSGDGPPVKLTEKEKNLLLLLDQAKGEEVSKRDLLDGVWGFSEAVETRTLETHIYRLRQKIEKNPAAPEIILTTENGYKL